MSGDEIDHIALTEAIDFMSGVSAQEIKEPVPKVVQQRERIARLIEAIKMLPGVSAPVAGAMQPARVETDGVGAERVQGLAMRVPFPGLHAPAQRFHNISRFLRVRDHPLPYVPPRLVENASSRIH